MVAYQVTDIREFMAKLFLKETFDEFLLAEAVIVTGNTFSIDGHVKKEYYSQEEWEELEEKEIAKWKELRGTCFQLIKGKKTPCYLKLVFGMGRSGIEKLIAQSGISFSPGDVEGFFLNVKYENQKLMLTSGVSMRLFTMDKSVERFWDSRVEGFLKHAEISFEKD